MTAGLTTKASGERTRTDIASRVIKASPQGLYRALLNPEAVASWQPPKGMMCRIYAFDRVKAGFSACR
jgi:uncharacterized protein YndB with AHSA1/START domain